MRIKVTVLVTILTENGQELFDLLCQSTCTLECKIIVSQS